MLSCLSACLFVANAALAVYDGDTINIRSEGLSPVKANAVYGSVRLWGAVATEIGETLSLEARAALVAAIGTSDLVCYPKGGSYGRLVARCLRTSDGEDVAELVIRAGLAAPEDHFSDGYYRKLRISHAGQ